MAIRADFLRTSDSTSFLREWLRSPLRTGAQWPSSQALAREMASRVGPGSGPVIELGPGTGAVTRSLLAAGVKEQDLILVEASPSFALLLQNRYPQARILAEDAFTAIARLNAECVPARAVVSSLPLFVYPAESRAQLLRHALDMLGERGPMVQFTYGVVSPLPLSREAVAREAVAHEVVAHEVVARRSSRVWANLWPAVVWEYRSAGRVALRAAR